MARPSVTVELWDESGCWVDVTPEVRGEITIAYGRSHEKAEPAPPTCHIDQTWRGKRLRVQVRYRDKTYPRFEGVAD